jgi:hypothetical protein
MSKYSKYRVIVLKEALAAEIASAERGGLCEAELHEVLVDFVEGSLRKFPERDRSLVAAILCGRLGKF